jgi:hypothetical protein
MLLAQLTAQWVRMSQEEATSVLVDPGDSYNRCANENWAFVIMVQ